MVGNASTSLRTGIIIVVAEPWTDHVLDRMRAESGRSGGARRVVVEFLGGQDCCLSAQEIHDRVRSEGARVGIASVYRALEGLDELGLVQRVDLGDGVSRFERVDPRGDHHHHLVCDDCGKVEPFEDSAPRAGARAGRGRRAATSWPRTDVVLRGACGDCRAIDLSRVGREAAVGSSRDRNLR